MRSQLVKFATIGAICTALNLGLLAILARPLGTQLANFVALLLSTVVNTAANRAWTFGVRGGQGLARHHLQSLGIFALTWAATSGALALLGRVDPGASTLVMVGAVALANVVSTVVRFVAMRVWIFRPQLREA